MKKKKPGPCRTYRVTIPVTLYHTFEVEASSRLQAEAQARTYEGRANVRLLYSSPHDKPGVKRVS